MTSFEQALGALQHLPDSHDTRVQAIDLRLALRNALWTLGELERLFVHLQEAEVLAEALGDPHRLGWVSVYLLAHFAQACDPDRALTSGQRALAMATTLGDIGLTVAAQHYLGGVYRSLGDYRQAVECFQKNVACLHGTLLQERLGLPGLASVFSRSHLVVSLAECGAFTEGQAPAAEGCGLPRLPITPIAVSWRPGRWAFGRCARATSARPSLCSNGPSISRKGLPPASRPLCRRALGGSLCTRRTDRRRLAAAGAGGGAGGGDALHVGPCAPDGLAGRGVSAGWPPERGRHAGAAGSGVLPGASGTGPRSLCHAASR